MKRIQLHLPTRLYEDTMRVAELQGWSISELLLRGAEHMVRCYSPENLHDRHLPEPRDLGTFRAPVDQWRDLANESRDLDG